MVRATQGAYFQNEEAWGHGKGQIGEYYQNGEAWGHSEGYKGGLKSVSKVK